MGDFTDNQRKRFSAAYARLDGDEGTLVTLAQMAVEDAPSMLDELDCEIRSSQLFAASETGHALKGLLSTFEVGPPVSELQALIDAARAGDADAASSLVAQLRPSLEKLVREVRDLTGTT